MPIYSAFLRAVNVGGRFVTMNDLKSLFSDLGFDDVDTFIQSGNVRFRTKERRRGGVVSLIEGRLEERFGYPIPAFLRTDSELRAIAEYEPFDDQPGAATSILYVAFLHSPLDDIRKGLLMEQVTDIDQLAVVDNTIYWRRNPDLGASRISSAKLERLLNVPTTVRNMTTVRGMIDRYCRTTNPIVLSPSRVSRRHA